MICQKCKKNEASVYYNENINGEKKEMYLCNKCANDISKIDFKLPFSMMDVMTKLGNKPEKEFNNNRKCNFCDSSDEDFHKTGRLGCANCYNEFSRQINAMLQNIHGKTEHIGKAPRRSHQILNTKNEIKKLKNALNEAIRDENYEKAVVIRDKIKFLSGSIE